jgi:hypothetical protein
MSPDSSPQQVIDKPARPVVKDSLHAEYLEGAVPQWLVDAAAPRKDEIRQARPVIPAWYRQASLQQREALDSSFKKSVMASLHWTKPCPRSRTSTPLPGRY